MYYLNMLHTIAWQKLGKRKCSLSITVDAAGTLLEQQQGTPAVGCR